MRGEPVVNVPFPTATDNCGSVILTSDAPAVFPPGTTTVTFIAKDVQLNTATATTTVTVKDTTPPTVQCPANVTAEATSAGGAVVSYPAATATDAVSTPTVTYSQVSGTQFPLGATTVTVTAKDAAGNTATCSFTVTVKDSTPPVIGSVTNLTVDSNSPTGAIVTFTLPSVTDAVDPSPTVSAAPSSGSSFSVGTTTVTVTAKDASGNASTKSFTVTVLSASQMTSNLIAAVSNAFPEATNLLQNALSNLKAGITGAACNQLGAFINQVQAQSGKKITVSQADQWIASAKRIKSSLGCQ